MSFHTISHAITSSINLSVHLRHQVINCDLFFHADTHIYIIYIHIMYNMCIGVYIYIYTHTHERVLSFFLLIILDLAPVDPTNYNCRMLFKTFFTKVHKEKLWNIYMCSTK